MKLSKKEKMLLSILGGVLVGIFYYQFVYKNQIEKIEALKEDKIKIETRYQEVMENIRLLEGRQEKIRSMTTTINFKSKEFYPTIMQEKIIVDLDTYLKKSILKGDIGFSEVSVESVQLVPPNSKEKGQSSFQSIVDDYKGIGIKVDNNLNKESVPAENSSGATVEMLKSTINFKGTYETVKSFVSKIETSNRQILITDISTTVGYNGELTGTMSLEFYAIPKISERDSEYLQWNMDGTYGKTAPFLIQKPEVIVQPSVQDNSNSSGTEINNTQQSKSDFAAIVKSITSDLPTVMIGKSNDSSQDTYINTVNNNIEKAEIELKKSDGTYYYKYRNSSKSYPSDYGAKGLEFIPSSERIIIEINSESRVNGDDKSGLQLNIVNGTDKIVEVQIKGDDKINPRVSISGDSSKVSITRK